MCVISHSREAAADLAGVRPTPATHYYPGPSVTTRHGHLPPAAAQCGFSPSVLAAATNYMHVFLSIDRGHWLPVALLSRK